MDFQQLVTPQYWTTLVASVVSILIMCVIPSMSIILFLNYAKYSWLAKIAPLIGGVYFFTALKAPLPGIEAVRQMDVLSYMELSRVITFGVFLFVALYFEAYFKDGRAKATENTLDLAMSHRRARKIKWHFLSALGFCFSAVGIFLCVYGGVILFIGLRMPDGNPMISIPWFILFASLYGTGQLFMFRARDKILLHRIHEEQRS